MIKSGGEWVSSVVRTYLSSRVARWWLPDEVRFVDEIPKTSVGKFDKKALRANAAALGST